jgi:hypothetical protein
MAGKRKLLKFIQVVNWQNQYLNIDGLTAVHLSDEYKMECVLKNSK